MKMIVGLGNPGKKYQGTRHNVGFEVLDELRAKVIKYQIPISKQKSNTNFQLRKQFKSGIFVVDKIIFVKPLTFMNQSGEAVSKLVKFYKIKIEDLYVVHDDLDIELGKYKIQLGKGPKVHNGLQSIYEKLGTNEFWHVRVGIENRIKMTKDIEGGKGEEEEYRNRLISGRSYVLQRFSPDERCLVEMVIVRIGGELYERLGV